VRKAPDRSHPIENEPQKHIVNSPVDPLAAKGAPKFIKCVAANLDKQVEDDEETHWTSHSEASDKRDSLQREKHPPKTSGNHNETT